MTEPPPFSDWREYAEACSFTRHYSSLRFAMLTVYFAIIGGLGAVAGGATTLRFGAVNIQPIAASAAILVTLVFLEFELVCERYLEHFTARSKILELELHGLTLTDRPVDRSSIKSATRSLFVITS